MWFVYCVYETTHCTLNSLAPRLRAGRNQVRYGMSTKNCNFAMMVQS